VSQNIRKKILYLFERPTWRGEFYFGATL